MSTKTPAYTILINGSNVTSALQKRLINLTLTDERSDKADQLDITLDDSDGLLTLPAAAASIELWIGYTGDLVNKGLFTVDEIEHSGTPDIITIRARSADYKSTIKEKREQSWHALTLGDILTTIAKRNGLAPVINSNLATYAIEHLDQTNESDLNLLARLGSRHNAVSTIKAGRLLFTPKGSGTTASGTDIAPVYLQRNQGDQHRYSRRDRENDYTGVQTQWNEKKHAILHKVIVGAAGNLKVLRHTYATKAEAETAAKAEWQKTQQGEHQLTWTLAHGIATLYPETPVVLQGSFKQEIKAISWVTSRVVHMMGDTGFTTRVEMEVTL